VGISLFSARQSSIFSSGSRLPVAISGLEIVVPLPLIPEHLPEH
jgi:hypothetical protein